MQGWRQWEQNRGRTAAIPERRAKILGRCDFATTRSEVGAKVSRHGASRRFDADVGARERRASDPKRRPCRYGPLRRQVANRPPDGSRGLPSSRAGEQPHALGSRWTARRKPSCSTSGTHAGPAGRPIARLGARSSKMRVQPLHRDSKADERGRSGGPRPAPIPQVG